MSVQMTYTGPDGNVNYDVSRETGGTALMKTGEKYTVSEDLAARLLIGGGWEAPQKRKAELKRLLASPNTADEPDRSPPTTVDATDGAVARADELGVDLQKIQGTGKGGRVQANDVTNFLKSIEGEKPVGDPDPAAPDDNDDADPASEEPTGEEPTRNDEGGSE